MQFAIIMKLLESSLSGSQSEAGYSAQGFVAVQHLRVLAIKVVVRLLKRQLFTGHLVLFPKTLCAYPA